MSSLQDRDRAHVWHPYTQHATEPEPMAVASAKDASLFLDDGREIIDGISSWWACLHGHAQPDLVRTLGAQAAELDHVLFAGATHEPGVALAEALIEVAPPGLNRVFYSDNGSTSVEIALKMAFQYWVHRGEPERRVFVSFDGGFHGETFGSMSVGDPDPFFEPFAPLLFETRRVAVSAAAVDAALTELGGRAAGVLIEPLIQGAAGMAIHTPEELAAIRGACDRHGVLMVADEVLTGFGRTGSLFACEQAGVAPDLMCLAKGLTGGIFPLAATLATEAIYEAFLSPDRGRAFFHGHTFTGNPLGCAIALESLRLVREGDVPARLSAIGERIYGILGDLCGDPRGHSLRRIGGIVAFDMTEPDGATGYLAGRAPFLRAAAIDRGVLLRPLGNVLYAMPPACTTDAQCDRIGEVMLELARLDPQT